MRSAIFDLFSVIRPRRLIETGTFDGLGSTTLLAEACDAAGVTDYRLITIEGNFGNSVAAQRNLAHHPQVTVLWGSTLPKADLPTLKDIQRDFVERATNEGAIYYDHERNVRAQRYFSEQTSDSREDGLLARALRAFGDHPDFVLLDSAGHLGWQEFMLVDRTVRAPFFLLLDDINHCKHHRSWQHIKDGNGWEVVAESAERFGWGLCRRAG